MPHIFKHPENGNKGIIVFSTVEFLWVFYRKKLLPSTKIKAIKPYVDRVNNRGIKPKYRKYLKKIREKYFIGLNYGSYTEEVQYPDHVDFHLAGEGTMNVEESVKAKHRVYPLCSRNFLPEYFKNHNYPQKYWDILYIGHAHKVKYVKELMQSIRKIYDEGKKYNVLLIITERKNETEKNFYTEIYDDYYKFFSFEERSMLTILKISYDSGMFAITPPALVHFYNSSKIFTIFTQVEGECRVIHEALLCGLPVVVKSDMKGGGRDYLNEYNSVQFTDYSNAHLSLIEAVENHEKFKGLEEKLASELYTEQSLQKLGKYMSELYSENGYSFDGDFINTNELHLRLPCHYYDLPWGNMFSRFESAHLSNYEQFLKFYDTLKL